MTWRIALPSLPLYQQPHAADNLRLEAQTAQGTSRSLKFPKSRGNINVAPKSIERFKQRIKELTGRSWGVSMEHRLSRLRSYLRGWMGYFGLANPLKLFAQLDGWIRRRIRMCYWLAVAASEKASSHAYPLRRSPTSGDSSCA